MLNGKMSKMSKGLFVTLFVALLGLAHGNASADASTKKSKKAAKVVKAPVDGSTATDPNSSTGAPNSNGDATGHGTGMKHK